MPRSSSLATVLSLLLATPALADFEGVMESRMTMEGGQAGMAATGKTYLSKQGMRMEMQMAGGGGASMKIATLILKSKPGVAFLVNDDQKTYTEMDGSRSTPSPEEAKLTVKKLGSERVAGYDCTHAVVTDEGGEQFEVWTTKQIEGAADYWAMHRNDRGRGGSMGRAITKAGVEGWPMKWVQKGRGGNVGWEVTKVEKRAVPAALFDLSAYKKTDGAAGVMGGPGGTDVQRSRRDAAQQQEQALQNLPPEQRKKLEELMKSMKQPK